jgi:LysR family transcriptional regulator, glycine cleavage system transcriptional activator
MTIPLTRLPSLDLIRGFVAVGRRMSITLAAQELCLTQSAVSRQVQALEEALAVKLFVRGHRSLTMTPEGERLFRSADGALQQLQDVIGAMTTSTARRPVTITSSVGVAGLWLLPRLGSFQQAAPGIDVRISANNRISDLRNDGIDLAIRYCAIDAMPDGALALFGETVAPVAHPSLGLRTIDAARILEQHTLLEFDGEYRPWLMWPDWLKSQGWEDVKPKGVLRFNHYDQVIHAAIAGQGIALGRLEMISEMLADRRLVTLAAPGAELVTSHAYYLIQAESPARAEVREVVHWIMSEAARTSAWRRGPA